MRFAALMLIFSLMACASVSGVSDAPAPFTTAPAPAAAAAETDYPIAVNLPAGRYQLDPRHASVIFRIRHMDLAWFTARFDSIDATLELDPSDPARSRLSASIDPNSVNTGVLSAQGERGFDRQIARALGGTPISFTATQIQRTGRNTARITGDLTMNGRTAPMVLEASFAGAAIDPLRGGAQVLGFSAHGQIQRAQWGVTQWASFAGDVVQIVIEVELVRG